MNKKPIDSSETTDGLKIMKDGFNIISGLSSGGITIYNYKNKTNPQLLSATDFGFTDNDSDAVDLSFD